MKISARLQKGVFFAFLAGISIWLICLFVHPFEPTEPQYRGKKLADWAGEIDRSVILGHPAGPAHQRQSELAISAIRHIGTNALPEALELCKARDSWLKQHLAEWIERYNDNHWPKRFPIRIKPAWEKNDEGDNIIWALGPMAEPAIPSLIQLLQNRDREVAESAMLALPGVGTNAIPPLVQLLDSPDHDVRIRAAVILGEHFGSQAHAAVPVLLECLEDQKLHDAMRIHAIHSLGLIKEDAPIVVPAIIRHIQNETNNWTMLSDYISALGNFGTNAQPAVPLLVRILESKPERPDFITPPKAAALVALEKIDPGMAKPFLEKWKVGLTNAPWSTNAGTGTDL